MLSVFNTDDGKLEYPGVVGDPIIPRLVVILYDGQLISLLSPNKTKLEINVVDGRYSLIIYYNVSCIHPSTFNS